MLIWQETRTLLFIWAFDASERDFKSRSRMTFNDSKLTASRIRQRSFRSEVLTPDSWRRIRPSPSRRHRLAQRRSVSRRRRRRRRRVRRAARCRDREPSAARRSESRVSHVTWYVRPRAPGAMTDMTPSSPSPMRSPVLPSLDWRSGYGLLSSVTWWFGVWQMTRRAPFVRMRRGNNDLLPSRSRLQFILHGCRFTSASLRRTCAW